MIDPSRTRILNDRPPQRHGRYVLYWAQQSPRAAFNPALDAAIAEANESGRPVLVCFGLSDRYPDANARHYAFLLEGLQDFEKALIERGVRLVVKRGEPARVAQELVRDAYSVFCDKGYLRHQRTWAAQFATEATCKVVQIEGDVVVPVGSASTKHEFAARTLRPRIARALEGRIRPAPCRKAKHVLDMPPGSDVNLANIPRVLEALDIDWSVPPVRRFRGGHSEARQRLARFVATALDGYAESRNKPEISGVSELSPYLHFGQISPIEIALAVQRSKRGAAQDRSSFLEELIVRRELAINHVYYAPAYDRYNVLPDWARKTLAKHANDPRPHRYNLSTLKNARTHDRAWNAAMTEMTRTGYMHNRLRMYWGKKIIEWSPSPEAAFRTVLYLNNCYFLDGRDANPYANVGWLFGLHDRPWSERPIFGTVRYLSENSLRKFDLAAYIARVEALVQAEQN